MEDLPQLSPDEAAQLVNRGMLRAELSASESRTRAVLREEMSDMLGASEVRTRGMLREEMSGMLDASESRTRVLIEDVRATLQLVLERLSDALGGNAQVARLDAEIADARTRADAAAALGPRVQDHEVRIRALEQQGRA